jgi:hypothetical protein
MAPASSPLLWVSYESVWRRSSTGYPRSAHQRTQLLEPTRHVIARSTHDVRLVPPTNGPFMTIGTFCGCPAYRTTRASHIVGRRSQRARTRPLPSPAVVHCAPAGRSSRSSALYRTVVRIDDEYRCMPRPRETRRGRRRCDRARDGARDSACAHCSVFLYTVYERASPGKSAMSLTRGNCTLDEGKAAGV